MSETYTKDWASKYPGCMIILLDQSGSMAEPFGQAQIGKGTKKCDAVANILNNFLNELISRNMEVDNSGSPLVKPRADIAVLGYGSHDVASALGGPLAGRDFVTLPELQMNPINIEIRKTRELDATGKIIEFPMQFPVWVNPVANGGTPMLQALQRARNLAQQWANDHPDNYPPVIVNITDGEAEGDLRGASQEVCQVSTSDGQALLFNVHITKLANAEVAYPLVLEELPSDHFARLLFSMSSVIPETSRALLETQLGRPVTSGAHGMIFNGDAASVSMMFNFASAPATRPMEIDPNM